MKVTCPSGLSGVIRGMKGREAQAFVDPQQQRTQGSFDTMLSNCWEETTDPGPYEKFMVSAKRGDSITTQPPWSSRALIGDRFAALIDIRIATFGPDYFFDVKCANCEQKFGWELSLADLPRKDFPKDALEKIAAGDNSFSMRLPDGKLLMFRIGTAVEERAIAKLKGGPGSTKKLGPVDTIFTQSNGIWVPAEDPIVARTVGMAKEIEFEGERMIELPGGPNGIRRYFEDTDFAVILEVLDEMQRPDGGVQTTIEVICDHCAWQQEIELPFQRTFFAPARKAKA